jgi:hypothetical protein
MPVAQGAHDVPFTHPNAAWTVTSSFPIGQCVHSFIHSVEWLISLWSSLSIHTPCDAPRSREHRVQCRPGTEAPCRGDGPPQQARLRRRHLPRWPLGPPPRSPAESGWSGQGVVLNDRGDDAAAANTTSSPSPGPGWPLDHLFVRQPSQDLQGVVLGVRVVRMGRHAAARAVQASGSATAAASASCRCATMGMDLQSKSFAFLPVQLTHGTVLY